MQDIFKDYPDIIEVKDLQNLLHIGRNKAYDLLRNNQIQSIKIGKTYKIPKQCIINYINGLSMENNNNEPNNNICQNYNNMCYNIIDFKSGLSIKGE